MAAKQPVLPAHVIGTRMVAAEQDKGTDETTTDSARKKDMRWQRTERHILQAFSNQLDQRPLNKISVTQLAAEAEINKATFYLHYADIYELAIAYARTSADEVVDDIEHPEAFFSDPELFAREFVAALDGEERFKEGRTFVENGLSSVFADRLAERIYEVLEGQELPESPEQSQMFLMFLVHGVMGLLPQYLKEDSDWVAKMAALVIEAMRGQ
ncbi:MAG: TetR/AcrR family transcriptional regulator [Coriobacteriales bacterium]